MIYVNGDSWTSGWPSEKQAGHRKDAWPHLLSKMVKINTIDDSRSGCSNYRIYRRTFDFLLHNRPEFSIVFLTKWVRVELGNSKSGKIYQHMPNHGDSKFFYLEHWNPYLEYSNMLRQIVALQHVAKSQGTKLYFLDTFKNNLQITPGLDWFKDVLKLTDAFDAMDDQRIKKKFSVICNLNKHIDYSFFISDRSYEELIEDYKLIEGHPTRAGHKKIAEIVFNKIFEGK